MSSDDRSGAGREPLSRRILFRVTATQLHTLDVLASEFGVSRTWLLRRAVSAGLPEVVAEVRAAADAGLRVAGSEERFSEAVRGPKGGKTGPAQFARREGDVSSDTQNCPLGDTEN